MEKTPTRSQKAKILWDFRRGEIHNYAVNLFNPFPEDKLRVMIFGQGRSGSTLLESLICSTPYFKMRGEILSPYYRAFNRHGMKIHQGEAYFPNQYIHGLIKQYPAENFIFHLKLYHLTTERKRPVDPASIVQNFYNQGWKIIFLRRENRVQHVLSHFLRIHRGRAHKQDDVEEKNRLTIDCDLFVEEVQKRMRFGETEREILQGTDFHEVVYDDDLQQSEKHQETIDGIFDFLGLPPHPVATKFKKVNTQSMEDLVINYAEFRQAIAQNGWEHLLD